MEKTTIQIGVSTLERLKVLRRYNRESYDELLNYIMNHFEEDSLSDMEINDIQIALQQIKDGRVVSIEDVAKELGVSLE